MKFHKLSIGVLLFLVLVVHPSVSKEIMDDTALKALTGAVPVLAALVGSLLAATPVGPFIVAGLGLLHVCLTLLNSGDEGPSHELTKLDLFKTQQALMKKIGNVDTHLSESTSKIIRELTHTVESHAFLENMRNTLEDLISTYESKMSWVLDPRRTKTTRDTIAHMMDFEGFYRRHLKSFITTYIEPTVILPTSGPIKLFFDFQLQKDHLLALENEDANRDSLHSKIFKSFMFLAKFLTDGYVLPLSAHTVQFQEDLHQNNTEDASATKALAEELVGDFRDDLKILMKKTKWALENSSREIKNSGSFTLKEGENCARLPFATTIPRVFYFGGSCKEDKEGSILKDYESGQCETHRDLIPEKSNLQIYKNDNYWDRPFTHLTFDTTTIGHPDSGSRLFKQSIVESYCSTVFCPAYKKNQVGISLQKLRAKRGNVITGVRWRMSKNILYMDVQQGKWLNPFEVDRNSVFWTETPEDSKQVAMLTGNLRKIEIGDHMVDDKDYLTSIQLKLTNQRYGLIRVFVEGSRSPNWNSFGAIGSYDNIQESNEIHINEGDDPARAPADAKRLVSMPAEPKEPAYIKFQVSGFENDFGRTTVPYIDTRPVFTSPPAPVVGFGIYHEAAREDGGLLALKLITPSLTEYVDYEKIEPFTKPE